MEIEERHVERLVELLTKERKYAMRARKFYMLKPPSVIRQYSYSVHTRYGVRSQSQSPLAIMAERIDDAVRDELADVRHLHSVSSATLPRADSSQC